MPVGKHQSDAWGIGAALQERRQPWEPIPDTEHSLSGGGGCGLGGISALPGRPFLLGIPQAAALKPGPETQAGREPGIIVAQTHPTGAG